MNEFVLRGARRQIVDTAGKWRELAIGKPWGRGKPLSELAERWTATALPEIDALLSSHPKSSGFTVEEGWVGLPELDVLVVGPAPGGRTLLAALAIADDPLGPTVAEAQAASAPLR